MAHNTMSTIRITPRNLFALITLLAALCAGVPSQATEIIREHGLIMSMPIEGVTLKMTPKHAFEHLTSNGFTAGKIVRFEDWTTPGILFRKQGAMKPSGFPEWLIEIALDREEGRLIHVSETSQKLDRTNYDLAAEIEQVRRHFGIAEDERKCSSSERGGFCSVVDATKSHVVFAIQVRPTTKSAQLTIMPK